MLNEATLNGLIFPRKYFRGRQIFNFSKFCTDIIFWSYKIKQHEEASYIKNIYMLYCFVLLFEDKNSWKIVICLYHYHSKFQNCYHCYLPFAIHFHFSDIFSDILHRLNFTEGKFCGISRGL